MLSDVGFSLWAQTRALGICICLWLVSIGRETTVPLTVLLTVPLLFHCICSRIFWVSQWRKNKLAKGHVPRPRTSMWGLPGSLLFPMPAQPRRRGTRRLCLHLTYFTGPQVSVSTSLCWCFLFIKGRSQQYPLYRSAVRINYMNKGSLSNLIFIIRYFVS